MDAFERAHDERFTDYMEDYLRNEAPEVVGDATRGEVRAFIHDGIRRGRAHGFEEEAHLEQYILFMAWVGPAFDQEQAWARRILDDATLEPEDKIFRLEDAIMTDWEGRGVVGV